MSPLKIAKRCKICGKFEYKRKICVQCDECGEKKTFRRWKIDLRVFCVTRFLADEILYISNQSESEKTILLYIVLLRLTSVGPVVVVEYTMCLLNTLTPVITLLHTVTIEIRFQRFTELVSLREIGKSNSRAEISIPNSLYLLAVKGASKILP